MQDESSKARPIDTSMKELPPAWRDFIRFCQELRFGELERLAIQDGAPVMAEITVKKVKFSTNR